MSSCARSPLRIVIDQKLAEGLERAWDEYDAALTERLRAQLDHPIYQWVRKAVTEDRRIVKLVPPTPGGPRYGGFYCEDYDGPTDGVAPV